ncbi:MAG: GNAT family N-acetyltransferase [Chloroflexi bacterium]|nr:GNAT family N-acetyltransferase [Chloroflexota bacterium]
MPHVVHVVSTKYDGSPHYAYDARLVGQVGPRLELFVPGGTRMEGYRGSLEIRVDFTAVFYTDGRWYNGYRNHWATRRLQIESYANVSLPATFDGRELRWIDLDLDVVLWRSGRLALVDVDEFREHRARFGYPPELVARAEATADDLLRAARIRAAPFDGAPEEGGRSVEIVPIAEPWRAACEALWEQRWGSPLLVSRGVIHDARALPGFVAVEDGDFAGAVTYRVAGDECEVVTLDARREGSGAGGRLLDAAIVAARAAGCWRLWLITTNDNTAAIRFYQRRGMRLAALHRDAITASRRLKPEIPEVGLDGVPIRDEIEFELILDA